MIRRAPRPRSEYLVVANRVSQDTRLSFRARGILIDILSRPDGWELSAERIAEGSPTEGRDAIRTALQELIDLGYAERRKEQNAQGQWRTVTDVYGVPKTDYPASGEPTSGEPSPIESTEPESTYLPLPTVGGNRPRDPVWDALSDVFGEPTTKTSRNIRNKVRKSLTDAGATDDEVRRRASMWPLHFDDATLTDLALEKHWDTLGRPPLRAASGEIDRYQNETARQRRHEEARLADERRSRELGTGQ